MTRSDTYILSNQWSLSPDFSFSSPTVSNNPLRGMYTLHTTIVAHLWSRSAHIGSRIAPHRAAAVLEQMLVEYRLPKQSRGRSAEPPVKQTILFVSYLTDLLILKIVEAHVSFDSGFVSEGNLLGYFCRIHKPLLIARVKVTMRILS